MLRKCDFFLNVEVSYTKFTVGKVNVVITPDVCICLLFRRQLIFLNSHCVRVTHNKHFLPT